MAFLKHKVEQWYLLEHVFFKQIKFHNSYKVQK